MTIKNLTRFFVLILGAFTPPPRILEPVVKIPLNKLNDNFAKYFHYTH